MLQVSYAIGGQVGGAAGAPPNLLFNGRGLRTGLVRGLWERGRALGWRELPHTYYSTLSSPKHTYIHTSVHIYCHTYIYAHRHAYVHTYMFACMHECIPTYIPTYLHTYISTYTHTYLRTDLPTCILTYRRNTSCVLTYIPTCKPSCPLHLACIQGDDVPVACVDTRNVHGGGSGPGDATSSRPGHT